VRELAAAVLGLVLLTATMWVLGDRVDLDNVMLLYLLSVILVGATLGLAAAVGTALATFLAARYLFASPIGDPLGHDHVVELLVFLAAAVVVSLIADARRRHRAQEQHLARQVAEARELAEIDRVRRGLLAAVSHDLRTPLAGIKANAAVLRDQPPGPVRAELLDAVEASADHLTEMVSNLLSMSRIDAGALSAHMAPVPLYEVVSRAFVTIDDSRTDIDVPEDLPLVVTDATLLERIVANLVRNAHQHALAAGGSTARVEVRARQEGSAVRLDVVDHGPGIPEDRWNQVFRPFQRLDDTGRGRDGSGSGPGLGLAIVRGFSNAVGATLTPSRTPGGGLTMSLTLPTGDASSPPSGADA
jgi:two-component system sensor histidine kinase KdpD